MEFIRIPSLADGVAPLADRLTTELKAGKQVAWIITGGSNIALCASVMKELPDSLTEFLTVFLTDERYGSVGHPDSNEKQLIDAGFTLKRAHWIKVLQDDSSRDDTARRYGDQITAACDAADTVIAQIGMGPDGHVCGILPGSPAVDSDKLVVGYDSDPYQRITLTPKALEQFVDAAYVFTFGEARRPALENLLHRDLSLSEQPAQVLKQLPEAYIYNDLLEGHTEEKE